YLLSVIFCSVVFSFFFFSSRRRHTRFDCDWSSDVCSSDLKREIGNVTQFRFAIALTCLRTSCLAVARERNFQFPRGAVSYVLKRSEERRVGKECRYWWSTYH